MSSLRALLFPVVWGGSIALSWLWVTGGGSPLVVVVVIGGCAVSVVAVAEFVIPFRRDWLPSWKACRTDALHLAISSWFIESLPNLAQGMLIALGTRISSSIDGALWPSQWPLAAQLVAAMLLTTFVYYWWHRAAHRVPLFWRLHAVHHSADRVYWLNATRVHPIEAVIASITGPSILFVLGVPAEVMVVHACGAVSFRAIQHSNLDLRWGPLRWVFNHNDQHRWHHSTNATHGDKNYGNIFSLWDVLFGTHAQFPSREPNDGVGIGGREPYPTTYLGQIAAPWRWQRASSTAPKEESCA